MKMHLYVCFSEYQTDGIAYTVWSQEDHESRQEAEKASPGKSIYKYLCEIDVPRIDKSYVLELGLKHIDKEIGGLQKRITEYRTKKQELLALDFKGDTFDG